MYVHVCYLELGVWCVPRSRERYRPVAGTRVLPDAGACSYQRFCGAALHMLCTGRDLLEQPEGAL